MKFITEIRAELIDYIYIELWDVFDISCPNFKGGLAKLRLKGMHGYVHHRELCMWLFLTGF